MKLERGSILNFFNYMTKKVDQAPSISLDELIQESGGIESLYLVYVDILKGFCEEGPLASDRVNEMVKPVANLSERLVSKGIPAENLIFLNDHHPEDAVEFGAFAPHCRRSTKEAEIVDALKPYYEKEGAQIYRKNATNGLFGVNQDGKRFFEWLEHIFQQKKSTFVIVGDCTDLCIYQNAMGIRLFANEKNASSVNVVVPISHVRTYDISVEQAEQFNIYAHDADFMDVVFLYHMQMNGIKVVSTLL